MEPVISGTAYLSEPCVVQFTEYLGDYSDADCGCKYLPPTTLSFRIPSHGLWTPSSHGSGASGFGARTAWHQFCHGLREPSRAAAARLVHEPQQLLSQRGSLRARRLPRLHGLQIYLLTSPQVPGASYTLNLQGLTDMLGLRR